MHVIVCQPFDLLRLTRRNTEASRHVGRVCTSCSSTNEIVREPSSLAWPTVCGVWWTGCHHASLLLCFLFCSQSLRPWKVLINIISEHSVMPCTCSVAPLLIASEHLLKRYHLASVFQYSYHSSRISLPRSSFFCSFLSDTLRPLPIVGSLTSTISSSCISSGYRVEVASGFVFVGRLLPPPREAYVYRAKLCRRPLAFLHLQSDAFPWRSVFFAPPATGSPNSIYHSCRAWMLCNRSPATL